MKKIIFLLLVSLMAVGTLQAQNWDIHTTQTINGWKMHGLSRELSHSGLILPVGVPTAMGIYALVRKDEPLLKEAIYFPSKHHRKVITAKTITAVTVSKNPKLVKRGI